MTPTPRQFAPDPTQAAVDLGRLVADQVYAPDFWGIAPGSALQVAALKIQEKGLDLTIFLTNFAEHLLDLQATRGLWPPDEDDMAKWAIDEQFYARMNNEW